MEQHSRESIRIARIARELLKKFAAAFRLFQNMDDEEGGSVGTCCWRASAKRVKRNREGGGGILELPPVFKTRDFLKVSPYGKCLNSMYFFPTNVVPKVGRVLNVANKFVDCTLVCFFWGLWIRGDVFGEVFCSRRSMGKF